MVNNIFGTNQDDVLVGLPGVTNNITAGNGNDTVTGWFLGDSLYGGNGRDTIYGDRGNSNPPPIKIPDASSPSESYIFAPPPRPTVILGNDYISGDEGDDFLVGDTGATTTTVQFSKVTAGAGQTVFSSFQLTTSQTEGNDHILGGNGDDIIFGDTPSTDLRSDTNGSTAIANGAGANAKATFIIFGGVFTLGSNTIEGGNGNDTLIGSLSFDDDEPGGGTAVASNGGIAKTIFTHTGAQIVAKKNLIDGGSGNDKIYGNSVIAAHEIVGGTAIANSGGIASTEEIVSESPLKFGDDDLSGDAGNDEIYGDARLYYNSISGGSANADGAGSKATSLISLENTEIVFGSDNIDGGSGDDQLFGDALQSGLEIKDAGTATATNGGVAEVIAQIKSFIQEMGDDTINGGSGNNTFVGDIVFFSLLDEAFVTNTVTVNGADHLSIADRSNNSITWGNDRMTGGSGNDDYNFTLFSTTADQVGTQGYDVITNFDVTKDSLSFGNMVDKNGDAKVDIADLAQSTYLSQLAGNTVLSFEGGGSITFLSTNISSLDELNLLVSASPIGFNPVA